MARHPRRGPSAPRREVLEPCALFSSDLPATSPALPTDLSLTLLVRFILRGDRGFRLPRRRKPCHNQLSSTPQMLHELDIDQIWLTCRFGSRDMHLTDVQSEVI